MTRKDYKLIAEILKTSNALSHLDEAHELYKALALSFAQELQKDNPRFKPALFLQACGI